MILFAPSCCSLLTRMITHAYKFIQVIIRIEFLLYSLAQSLFVSQKQYYCSAYLELRSSASSFQTNNRNTRPNVLLNVSHLPLWRHGICFRDLPHIVHPTLLSPSWHLCCVDAPCHCSDFRILRQCSSSGRVCYERGCCTVSHQGDESIRYHFTARNRSTAIFDRLRDRRLQVQHKPLSGTGQARARN